MSTPNPALAAAAPSLINSITALEQFVTNLGTDPLQAQVKLGPALGILINTWALQVPGLEIAEFGVVTTEAMTKLAAVKAHLLTLVPTA